MTVIADRAIEVQGALGRATHRLLSLQSDQGWWKGELETNVTIDAEDIFLRHFLGLLDPAAVAATAKWIRGASAADSSWATYFGGPGESLAVHRGVHGLRIAGDPRTPSTCPAPPRSSVRPAAQSRAVSSPVCGSR